MRTPINLEIPWGEAAALPYRRILGRRMAINLARFCVCLFLSGLGAKAQEPKDAVAEGIQKLRKAGNYTWALSTTMGGGDTTPQYFTFPALRGKTTGQLTSITARSAAGEVEVIKKEEKKASRIRNQWKTPEEIRQTWLRQSEVELKARGTNSAAAAVNASEQINPVDEHSIFLGNDPTAVAGEIMSLPPIIVGSGRRARALPPRAGATMARDQNTNAPVAELPDAGTMTEMLLEALPDPVAEAEFILDKASVLKPAGAGYYVGELAADFVAGLAEARKRTGDNRPPQINTSRSEARFWISQGALYKYQVAVQATMIVGPAYNPLTLGIDRTVTVEFRGTGLTKVDVPPAAAKLLAP